MLIQPPTESSAVTLSRNSPFLLMMIVPVGTSSVSYTHLDVYKRQVLAGQSIRMVASLHSLQKLRGVAKAEIKFTIEIKDQPKDVYKRQLPVLCMDK